MSAERPTREEERELFLNLRAGLVLREDVVEQYLWLIPLHVDRFGPRFREDLEQEGVLALYRALDLFDVHRGLRFSTYAGHWLNQAFHAWLYDNTSTVRIPAYMRKAMAKLSAGKDTSDLNPSVRERARRLSERVTFGDLRDEVVEDEDPDVNELSPLLAQSMRRCLSPRERRLIRMRFWRGMTLREIGQHEGVTLERVRQIIKRALGKLESDTLRELL